MLKSIGHVRPSELKGEVFEPLLEDVCMNNGETQSQSRHGRVRVVSEPHESTADCFYNAAGRDPWKG